jgi:hypothetical protein
MTRFQLAAGAAACAILCAASSAYAQEMTGGIVGTVTDAAGKPVAGATLLITDKRTGQTTNGLSGATGGFTVANLPPTGDYSVKATTPSGESRTFNIGQIPVGAPYRLDVTFGGETAVSEIVITATHRNLANAAVQTSPRSTFTADQISAAPSFQGDLRDLIRTNPFVTVDASNSNAIIVAGANNRTNTIYLDGVRQSDDFGLNASGYPTQRSPFSPDVVQSFNFDIAPYDVRYGQFEGGVLNVVTKSGSNELHGGAFWSRDSNYTAGDTIGAKAFDGTADRKSTTKFRDIGFGFNLGGPIWKDHLFFFTGYEKYNGVGSAGQFVPGDVAGANPIPQVAQSDVTQVQDILKSKYGYDPLNYAGTGPVTDTKWFAKLDWYITDNHHLAVSYQSTDGLSYNNPNGSTQNKILNLQSNDYTLEQKLTAYMVDLTSHWTPRLSSEVQFSRRVVQTPTLLFTDPFAQFQIQLPTGGNINLGPDISRQANNLETFDKQGRIRVNYALTDHHTLTAGYEHDEFAEFDLFVQNATGAYTFSNGCGPGLGLANGALINLQDGVACALTYQNAFDNNPQTAAATVNIKTETFYVQDEWRPTPELTVRGGLRYEHYASPNVPLFNQRFLTQYGFANTATIDGLDIWMPRFGVNWQPDKTLTVYGGAGLFSGGNPAVWLYNSFDNTGNIIGNSRFTCATATCTGPLLGVTGSSIPASAQAAVSGSAALGTGNVAALDPNFKEPSVWKFSIGAIKTLNFTDYDRLGRVGQFLGDNWHLHGDFYYSKTKEGVNFVDLWALQNELATPGPDGRPIFDPARYTNALKRTSGTDVLLTNTDKGDAKIFAIGVGKDWTDGWARGLSVDYTFTHQNVNDVSSATSSVATSNLNNTISANENFPELATSNYEIRWKNQVTVNYQHAFFGDNRTTFTLFAYNRAGLPYSYAFCTTNSGSCASPSFTGPYDQLTGTANSSTNHALLYLPAGANGVLTPTSDPRVVYASTFDLAGFNNFIQGKHLQGYEGTILPRNGFRSKSYFTGDLHLGQEFPLYPLDGSRLKAEFFMDIINFPNLLNKNWGALNQVSFPYAAAPVTAINCQLPQNAAACSANGGKGTGNYYLYQQFKPSNVVGTIQSQASPPTPTWVIKFGARVKF